MGIGPGRALEWLGGIKDVAFIVGVDFSKPMLEFCGRIAKKCSKRVILIQEDFRSLSKTKMLVRRWGIPKIFVCLVNTLGNFPIKERVRVLRSVRKVMSKKDRFVVMLYKLPEDMRIDGAAIKRIPPHLRPRGCDIAKYLELIDYSFQSWIWNPVVEIFGVPPIITYDEKTHDIAVYANKKKVFSSHRWRKSEIEDIFKKAGLRVYRVIEGNYAYVVISKK
ncbi:MAG: hypothetical protein QXF56_02700 [Candidatus Micrarchaeia archaeon]